MGRGPNSRFPASSYTQVHSTSPEGARFCQEGITNPEVVINVAHKHGFIVFRSLQVGWPLLRIGSILSLKPLFVAHNDLLLAVPLKEADEELHDPQGSFPERHHDQHLRRGQEQLGVRLLRKQSSKARDHTYAIASHRAWPASFILESSPSVLWEKSPNLHSEMLNINQCLKQMSLIAKIQECKYTNFEGKERYLASVSHRAL